MTQRVKTSSGKELIVFVLLFLAAMNFGAKFFYFVILSFLIVFVKRGRIEFNTVSILYLLLCTVMGVYNFKGGLMHVLRCFAPFCFYLVGLNLISDVPTAIPDSQKVDYVQKKGYAILTVISLGAFVHYALNFLYNIGNSVGRNTNDIWTGSRMAATGQNALICLMLGLSCALLFLPPKKWHRWGGVASLLLMLAYNMVLSCRTMLVMLGILLLIGVMYPKKNTTYGTQLLENLTRLIIICGIAFVVYKFNIGGIQRLIRESTLFSRFEGSFTYLVDIESRVHTKMRFLTQLVDYPFGDCHIRSMYGYAHDLLLDAYDEYGMLVFCMLCCILIIGMVQLFSLLRRTGYTESFMLMLLLIYCAILLEFAVEPILVGMPWLFSCYCLINGCVTGMNRIFFSTIKRNEYQE